MPERVCSEPFCPDFAVYRGRCETHRNQTPAITRSKEEGRLYDLRRWRRLRLKKLQRTPVCQECGLALASDVDHVTPIAAGGDPWAMSNLSSLCKPCHSAKTRGEQLARAS